MFSSRATFYWHVVSAPRAALGSARAGVLFVVIVSPLFLLLSTHRCDFFLLIIIFCFVLFFFCMLFWSARPSDRFPPLSSLSVFADVIFSVFQSKED